MHGALQDSLAELLDLHHFPLLYHVLFQQPTTITDTSNYYLSFIHHTSLSPCLSLSLPHTGASHSIEQGFNFSVSCESWPYIFRGATFGWGPM